MTDALTGGGSGQSAHLSRAAIDETALNAAMLEKLTAFLMQIRWVLVIPLVLLAAIELDQHGYTVMLSIFGAQLLCCLAEWHTTGRLHAAVASGSGIERARRWKTISLYLLGAGWGLSLIPIAHEMTWGIAPMYVILTLVVAVGLLAISFSSIPAFRNAILAGYVSMALPVCLWAYDAIGPIPFAATLFYAPAVMLLSKAFGEQTRRSVENEMQNGLLAQHLQSALDTAEYLSSHDCLTGLLNRRAVEREAQALRGKDGTHGAVSIILFDLDLFKDINDHFGHAVGDVVLKSVATTLKMTLASAGLDCREGLSAGRWGGEEFIVVLAGVSGAEARAVADLLRLAVTSTTAPDLPIGLRLTASFGVTEWLTDEPMHEAIGRADEAMYAAKEKGRDRVVARDRLIAVKPRGQAAAH